MKRWMISIFLILLLAGCKTETEPAPTLTATPARPQPTLTPTSIQKSAPTEPVPIIYDDDGSLDGTVALLYLLGHPLADLKAISVSYGEAYPDIYIQHLGRQLDALNLRGIPLGYGQSFPLAGDQAFPEFLRQLSNNYWGVPIPNPEKTYPVESAVDLFVRTINQSTIPVTIFMTGPATNLAQALRQDPGIKDNIASVYIMGGAVYVPGNISGLLPYSTNRFAEWNIYVDPTAASEVFSAGLEIFLVPLDATNHISINQANINQWREGGELAKLSADLYEARLTTTNSDTAEIWDLMTAPLIFEPSLCKYEALHLEFITDEGDNYGQINVVPGEPANANVCLEPDVDGLLKNITEVLSAKVLDIPPVVTPTETQLPTPTSTPVGLIFRDDFSQSIEPGWEWVQENPDAWHISEDGWLIINSQDTSLLNDGSQTNLLCRDTPEGDFQISIHLYADPVANFQQATLFLYQDGDNFIAINRGFCSLCQTGGKGIYMDYKFSGDAGSYYTKTEDNDVFLRLVREAHIISGYYAFDENDWRLFGKVGYYLEEPKICIGASNVDSAGKEFNTLIGSFDYFEITEP